MKKIISILICAVILAGCQDNDASANLYNEMIDILENADNFTTNSKYFSATFETTITNEGNRYYIVIDNPNMAMYDVNVLAFEDSADLTNEFAPNAGIFDSKINLVPNQINIDNGFAKGVSISGLLNSENPIVYCLVQWKDEKKNNIYREFLKFSNNS